MLPENDGLIFLDIDDVLPLVLLNEVRVLLEIVDLEPHLDQVDLDV